MALGDRVNFICISLMPKSSNKMSAFDLPDQPATILGDTHIPRSWEAGYNLFDLRDQLGSASQQLNTGYTRPSHGEYWILTCPCVLTLTARTLEIIAYFVFLITSFVEGGGGSVFWSSSSQWPGFIHISCYCSSLSPSCLALAGRVQSPIPGYYLAPWPLTESVHTNNN